MALLTDISVLLTNIVGSIILLLFFPILSFINYRKKKTNFPTPKAVVITGASSGIGRGIALEYAKRKKTTDSLVLGLTGRNIQKLQELKNECLKLGVNVEIESIDVTDKEKLNDWLISFDNKYKIDVLIANAGTMETMLPKEMEFSERMLTIANTNVIGTLNTVLPMIPIFETRRSGQIVLMSSITPFCDYVMAGYTASKGFIKSFGLTLRNGVAPRGVGVSVLAPGFIYTPLVDSLEYEKIGGLLPITTDDASKYIIDGISRNDALISFPPISYFVSHFISTIPPNLKDGFNFISNLILKYPDYSKPLSLLSSKDDFSSPSIVSSSPIANKQKEA
ncbi:hypothetical protein RB653_009967 [Dictyostelium firmibasis]|uniref:Uncharacterized protein n=1 Tax=Dictyostelium firmibasis TaxID=79012 RepID=A0AAN7YKL2_9MYCE